jgi:hypothetical protein
VVRGRRGEIFERTLRGLSAIKGRCVQTKEETDLRDSTYSSLAHHSFSPP